MSGLHTCIPYISSRILRVFSNAEPTNMHDLQVVQLGRQAWRIGANAKNSLWALYALFKNLFFISTFSLQTLKTKKRRFSYGNDTQL